MFLGNNGVATFRSQRFRRISETCCSTIVIPPMEWDFPVYNIHKIIGQRIRNFVANGNMLVLTGGILAVEFINSYFFYNIELADGNYSPGPYRRLDDVPVCLKAAPVVLPQKGIAVTAVKKESLPSGTEVCVCAVVRMGVCICNKCMCVCSCARVGGWVGGWLGGLVGVGVGVVVCVRAYVCIYCIYVINVCVCVCVCQHVYRCSGAPRARRRCS